MGGTAPIPQAVHHFDPVHVGHPDVGDDQVGTVPLGGGQSLFTVRSLAHHGAAQSGPVHPQDDAPADNLLVVHD